MPLQTATQPVYLGGMKNGPEHESEAVTQRLSDVLGSQAVAVLLGISEDTVARWSSGSEVPDQVRRASLADLDALIGRMLSAFTPAQARLWLKGQDPYLSARPIDVYRLEGPAPLVAAIQAYEEGSFA